MLTVKWLLRLPFWVFITFFRFEEQRKHPQEDWSHFPLIAPLLGATLLGFGLLFLTPFFWDGHIRYIVIVFFGVAYVITGLVSFFGTKIRRTNKWQKAGPW